MKYLFLVLALQPQQCWAKEYKFTFNVVLDGKVNTLKYKVEAKKGSDALREAGIFCNDFFGIGKRDLTEDQVDAIIDGCTNPTFD